MKKILKNSKDWENYKNHKEGIYIQSESEISPTEYPCVMVETKLIEGCEHVNDQFVRFVYIEDFTIRNIRLEKLMELEIN